MIGLDVKDKPYNGSGKGVGGPYNYWQLPAIDFSIEDHEYMAPFQVLANPNLQWPCILGEDTIFKIAEVSFRYFEKSFDLSFRADIN